MLRMRISLLLASHALPVPMQEIHQKRWPKHAVRTTISAGWLWTTDRCYFLLCVQVQRIEI